MLNLIFVTGNQNKFTEASRLIPDLVQKNIDLPEIQETNTQTVLKEKVEAARKHLNGSFFVEDVSLFVDALNPFPGTFIKWFVRDWGLEKIVATAKTLGNTQARAVCSLGVWHENQFLSFEGIVHGQVVPPRGNKGFGWDAIFCPQGSALTFAEMEDLQKQSYSMRALAISAMMRAIDSSVPKL